MREITKHIIHCSATPNDRLVTTKEIRTWHIARGWSDIGYHFIIHRGGNISHGRPCNVAGAHCKGFNDNSIGTCLIGTDKFTSAQMESLIELDRMLKHVYNKEITTHGHNEFTDQKTCPNFDVQTFFKFANKTIV